MFKTSSAQDCKGLLLEKVDQFYLNVKIKQDSLAFLSCNYIKSRLKKDEIFIDFFDMGGGYMGVFLAEIITKDIHKVVEIPIINSVLDSGISLPINEEIKDRGVIVTSNLKNHTNGYYDYNALAKYIEPYLTNIKTIYYSTCDLLNFVNFKFLKSKKGRCLLEDYELIRLHTAASFLGNRKRLTMPKQLNALLIGNLQYNCTKAVSGKQSKPDRDIWQYLPGTKKEIENIQDILKYQNKITLLDSCNATENRVVSLINNSKYDVIHIATHGFYFKETNSLFGLKKDSYSLLQSGIVLSGANNPNATIEPFNEEGMLTSLDLINLDFSNVKLITLSICHSGEGATIQAGAPLGLTLALLRNGANGMMLSNREVPDTETTIFMATFYRYLNSNKDADQCFNDTLKELIVCYPRKDWSFFDLVH